jgi:hypothetical protein
LRRFLARLAATAALCTFGVVAVASRAQAQASGAPPPAFGSAPTGNVPIFFNDRHVYAKPDHIRQSRTLAAIVFRGELLVPMRSLFEQMGATTIAYTPKTRSVEVSKPGADVIVTIGKPIATINGEDRPLDVPPEMIGGTLFVPVRVISESMGAFVQWVSERRIVVIRYTPGPAPTAPPTAPPATPAPTAPPTVTPTASPTPLATATPVALEELVAADYDIAPIVYNEVSPGDTGKDSFEAKGDFELPLAGHETLLLSGSYRHLKYAHNADLVPGNCLPGQVGCQTVVGSASYQFGPCPSPDPGCVNVVGAGALEAYNGLGQAYVPAFEAKEDQGTIGLGIKLVDPRIYLSIGGFFQHYNYLGYPNVSGIGVGLDKLPDLENAVSVYGSFWYYPTVGGNYTYPTSTYLGPLSGQTIPLRYSVLKFDVGAAIGLGKSPFYLDLGYSGDRFNGKVNAPSDTTLASPYAGLGLHF